MRPRAVIAIGASAGGTQALTELVERLEPDIPAAILVVVHIAPYHDTLLPDILSNSGPVPATKAVHGEPLREGHIFVAPADRHLLVRDGRAELDRGARENHARPAIDPLMRSAAREYRQRAAGVILSGTQGDGTVGLMAIRANGGLTVVQDPAEVIYSSMPRRAIQFVDIDHVAPVRKIAQLLMEFARSRPAEPLPRPAEVEPDQRTIQQTLALQHTGQRSDEVSVYACPECGGTLWQVGDGPSMRFSCHVGHAYSPELLLVEKSEGLETALWSAVRTMVERITLTRQLAERQRESGRIEESITLEQQAQREEEHMVIIRDLIIKATPNPGSAGGFLAEADESREA